MKAFRTVALIGSIGLILGLLAGSPPAAADGRWLGPDHRVEHRHGPDHYRGDHRYRRDHPRGDYRHWDHPPRRDVRVYRYYDSPRVYHYYSYPPPHGRYYWDDDIGAFIRFGLTIPLYVD